MADITMCSGEGCDKKTQCYRYTALPNLYLQPYYFKPPLTHFEEVERGCTKFWSNKDE
jgi:hypothetical protein